ncbi:MAG: prepilin-type N-terminal cleavage/methylation domain-containing protein [Thermodesulfobacteriota bacterium]
MGNFIRARRWFAGKQYLLTGARGFTLLEVMIALALLGGVVITALISYNYHLSLAARNRDMVVATLLGRERMEEIDLLGPPVKMADDFGEEFPGFAWQFSITKDRRFERLDRMDITVLWGNERSLSLSSYRLQR